MLIITMGGKRTQREGHPWPAGGRSPRPGQTRRLKSWVSRADVRVRPPRLKLTDRKAAGATGSSAGDAATDKEAAKRRLGELHRLFNSRKESLNATYRRNAEANDKACDLNQKSVLALDALAEEYVDFEVTMANVALEEEAGDALHVATLEVAEELERTLKEQSRLQDDREVSNRRAVHDELSMAAKQALQRTLEVKRKATELQEDVAIQR